MSILSRIALCFALLGTTAGAIAWQKRVRMPDGDVLPGLKVDGEAVSPETLEAVTRAHAGALLSRELEVRVEGVERPVGRATLGDLGVRVDVARVLAEARAFGHLHTTSDWLGAIEDADSAKRGEVDVPLSPEVDADRVIAFVAPLKDTLDTSPASARLDLDSRAVIPERDGRSLDAWATVGALRDAASAPGATFIVIKSAKFPPRITGDVVAKLDVHAVVGEFETFFSRGGDQQRRGKNIDNAASKLDGLIISPGEVVSFNAVVGDRSVENGFEKSWEIFKGEMVEGVGGGTCQVASTLHAAAFFGGLDVIERLPHSRPSAYIPMGLDSTVVYPAVDLKLRNPHDFAVVVHAKAAASKLRIELLGARKPVKVSFARAVEKTLPFARKIEEVSWLTGTKVIVKQHGIRGYRIKRTRTIAYAGGGTKQETSDDLYPPTIEIYQVPSGFDVSLLPALPEAPAEGAASEATDATPAATPCTSDCAGPSQAVTFVNAPGAHTPTSAQAEPPKTLFLSR